MNHWDQPYNSTLHLEKKPDPFNEAIVRNMTEGELVRYSDCSAAIRSEVVRRYEYASTEWYEEYLEEHDRKTALEKELRSVIDERDTLQEQLDAIRAIL